MEEPKEFQHPETLEDKMPTSVSNIFLQAIEVATSYGWFIFFGCVVCYQIWKSLQPKLERWMEDAEYHKNPDKFVSRENAILSARQRLQEQYEKKAKEHAEKVKEKEEEEKRRRALARTAPVARANPDESSSPGNESSVRKPKTSLRPDYNPLLGGSTSSSCSWRPTSRGRTGGG